jgi:hypothetical protein
MLGGGSPYDPYAYNVNPTKTSKGKIMKNLVLLNDMKITYAKLILSNHYSQKIIQKGLGIGLSPLTIFQKILDSLKILSK